MNKSNLKKFATHTRRSLMEQVGVKLEYVMSADSSELRSKTSQIRELQKQIDQSSKELVIERVAYTWFNRLMALRFMDARGYNNIKVVSPVPGHSQPEILEEAKKGHIENDLQVDQQLVHDLLDGHVKAANPQNEGYKLLLVAECNKLYSVMPFMFEKIADYTELLLPDDLLGEGAILSDFVENMSVNDCEDVEVVGWLYQFYISEKKDEVFAGLKKNQKITPENIPAATQLFTPHWIVCYLVENSLGRLWMLNKPQSRLIDKMDYYIKPKESETNFLLVTSPEEIKICDPACGSGHMLVYAFDLLYTIYEEEGYDAVEITRLILDNNLYGIEIDKRAGELASFALFMKAWEKDTRFFKRDVQPQICVLQNVHFEDDEIEVYMAEVGHDLFTVNLQTTLRQFEEADNFGFLIRPLITDTQYVMNELKKKNLGQNIFLQNTHERVLQALKQADYLTPKYHVVIANPPYMGANGMNVKLKKYVYDSYPDSKSDLMTCFMERANELVISRGRWGMINFTSWMFLGSFETLRIKLLNSITINSLLHLGRGIFGSDFGTVAFVFTKGASDCFCAGMYYRLFENASLVRKPEEIRDMFTSNLSKVFHFYQKDFTRIPGFSIAYWFSPSVVDVFNSNPSLDNIADVKVGLQTGDNEKYLRLWSEVSVSNIGIGVESREKSKELRCKWFPYNKGGEFRKWYGNQSHLVNWLDDGKELYDLRPKSVIRSPDKYFQPAASWSKVTIGAFSLRFYPKGFLFDVAGCSIFTKSLEELYYALGAMNSPIMKNIYSDLMPTVNYEVGQISKFPIKKCDTSIVKSIVDKSRIIWDSFETSWDFQSLPLIATKQQGNSLQATFTTLRQNWQISTEEMQRLEEENNRIFINTYGLQDELTPQVPLNEITLTCNPHYRYGGDKSAIELESLLLADTIREFISYAVGCLLGRYSLDKEGLILANQGETVEDSLEQVPNPSFMPDKDNVLPVLDDEYFTDDIIDLFKQFLKVTFGKEHYEENLRFVEEAIGKDIRKYFTNEFYSHHVRMYKKRPIYWMFSSPQKSFNVLIYMHRYQHDTVSRILNVYLREFQEKLKARKAGQVDITISESTSVAEKNKANKEINRIDKILVELEEYERDILYPLATKKIEIDLDDGVKVNYNKFGNALQYVPGLSEK